MKRALAILLCSGLLLAACGGDGDEPSSEEGTGGEETPAGNVVPIEVTEFQFGMPDLITGGVVTLEATNTGGLPHELAFGEIQGDHDIDDVMEAIESEKEPPWFTDIAGIPIVSPGVTASMTRELDEGRYIFLCFLPTAEGAPHVTEGMVKVFDAKGTSEAEFPEPDYTFTATEEGFEVPAEITAGTHTIELVNEGDKLHEFQMYSPDEGKTEKDVNQWFRSGLKGDAPAVFPGGMQTIEPGLKMFIDITFESGRTYLLNDFTSGFEEKLVIE